MREFDFSPLLRSTIGFDNVNRLLEAASRADASDTSYPPYNIEKVGETDYRISMAVAGFTMDELNVTVRENVLHISGKAQENDASRKFLHHGIARRAFERRFQLADNVIVTGAKLEHGVLHLELVREIPETHKPRQIAIETPGDNKVIDNKAA